MIFTASPSATFLKMSSGCLLPLLLILIPSLSQAQENRILRALNAAVHDSTFLNRSPEIRYPVLFTHQQKSFYQAHADAPVQLLPAGYAEAPVSQVALSTFKWDEAKQKAKLKLKWDNKIVKLSVREAEAAAYRPAIRAMKVRTKNKIWPSYLFYNSEI